MPSTPERDAYSIEEARQRLGGIARQTIYDLINAGELDSLTVGTRRLIPAAAISRFIERHTSTSQPPAA